MNFDVIVVGSGPGGYVAAIRAAQAGLSTALIERAELGGICLNWGCIPTKALLKSGETYKYAMHAAEYGVKIDGSIEADLSAMVDRSRGVAEQMSKGVQYLIQKNKIQLIQGQAKIKPGKKVEVRDQEGALSEYSASHIILATGARSRELPNLPQDGEKIIAYRQAMTLRKKPTSILVVGSGAIGSEFAHFYNSIGVQVYLVEYLPAIVPVEDADVSAQLGRCFKKNGMKVLVDASVENVRIEGEQCEVLVKTKKGEEKIMVDLVLSAVGVVPNIENLGLEDCGIQVENHKICVDTYYRTNVEGYYAIGDITAGPALAHVASHEALICVDKIAGKEVQALNYANIAGCTYTTPEVSSVGLTEKKAREAGFELKIGKFPFTASGKATAGGLRDGFVKVIFDAKTDLLLGCHMIGDHVTEMISEAVMVREKNLKAQDILHAVHPHPSMSEAFMEATAAAYGEAVHI